MMQRSLIGTACAAIACANAHGAFVGGKVYSDPAWNAAATAAIGENAIVYRMFACWDDAADRLLGIFDANFEAKAGTLYQNDVFGGDHADQIFPALFPTVPAVQWDSYVSIGNLTNPSNSAIDAGFMWSPGGVTNDSNWFNPSTDEGQGRAPGVDPIPSALDNGDGRFYTFIGQFTLIGVEGDGGFLIGDTHKIDGAFGADAFNGSLSVLWDTGQGTQTQTAEGVQFIPAPGGAAVLALLGIGGARRTRGVRR